MIHFEVERIDGLRVLCAPEEDRQGSLPHVFQKNETDSSQQQSECAYSFVPRCYAAHSGREIYESNDTDTSTTDCWLLLLQLVAPLHSRSRHSPQSLQRLHRLRRT